MSAARKAARMSPSQTAMACSSAISRGSDCGSASARPFPAPTRQQQRDGHRVVQRSPLANAAAARTAPPLSEPDQRERTTVRADECFVLPLVFEPAHAVVRAAHRDLPAPTQSLPKRLDYHEQNM